MKQQLWKEYLRFGLRAAVFLLVMYLLFTKILFLGQVEGMEMSPSLKDGDLALGYRLQQEFRTGDVIVYEEDGARHFGRIAEKESKASAEEDLLVQEDGQTEKEEEVAVRTVSKEQVQAKVITILRRRGL